MSLPSSGVTSWFGTPHRDARYLELWRNAPTTYTPEQPVDENWNIDRYEVVLGHDSSGQLFQRAGRLVLRNRFYPSQVMVTTSDYQLAGRSVQEGDRVVQRIRMVMLGSRPLLETLTMNEVTEVIDEPRQKGFTYTTTSVHSEIGEWSPSVFWRDNGEVALVIEVVSRSRPGSSELAKRITRWMQLRAHSLSIANFRAMLSGERYVPEARQPFVPPELAPVGMLGAAMLLLMLAVRKYMR